MYLFSIKLKSEDDKVEYKKFVAENTWEVLRHLLDNYGNYEIEYINKDSDIEVISE